jgi:hypothetical protein
MLSTARVILPDQNKTKSLSQSGLLLAVLEHPNIEFEISAKAGAKPISLKLDMIKITPP